MDNTYSADFASLPSQKVSDKVKLRTDGKPSDWAKQSVNAIANIDYQGDTSFRKSPADMQVNYDLVNCKFEPKDVLHVLNPTNNPDMAKMGGLPARYQHYDIIASKLNELEGEEIKRPFNFRAYGTSGGVLSRQKEKKEQLTLTGLQNLLAAAMGAEQDPEQVPLDQVEDYFKTKYKDPAEVGANQILKALIPKLGLQRKFNKGFRHVMAAAEEVYWVGSVNGEPQMRTVNPLYSKYDLDPDLDFIEDGQWFSEERWMSTGSVLDEFRSHLSDHDVHRLDTYEETGGAGSYSNYANYAYQSEGPRVVGNAQSEITPGAVYKAGIAPGNLYGNFHQQRGRLHRVVKVCWRSMREVGFLKYTDEQGKPQETLVDPAVFKLTKEMKAMGYSLDTQWITDVWEGTRIGRDIYVDVHPLENQTGKLPYCGYVYSAINSQATSLVDRVKPLQYLYNVTWFRLELELAKAKGKQIIVDAAAIPRTGDWAMSQDQWLYYQDTLGIIFIDSTQEGMEGNGQTRSNFSNYQTLDRTISNNVGSYLQILEQLKTMVGDIIGVSRQREGNITSNETVGGVERAVSQSNNITEPLFYYHNLVKQNVLTQLVQVAALCYADGIHGQYIIDDVTREWINVNGGQLVDSEFSVFIRDSSKDAAIIQKMEMMADRMLQSNQLRASTFISMLDTDSISEMKADILQAEDAQDKREEAQQEQAQEMQTQTLQAQQAEKDADRQFTAEQGQLDRDNDIRKSYISATKGASGDGDGNGSPDGLDFIKATSEQGKVYSQNLKIQADAQHKQQQLAAKQQSDERTAQTKQQEIGLKIQQHADKTATEQQKLVLAAEKLRLDARKLESEQAINAREQAQQNKIHADKMKMDKEAHALKQRELKVKIKQANKPNPKK